MNKKTKARPLWNTGSRGCLVTSLSPPSKGQVRSSWLTRAGQQSHAELSSLVHLAEIGPRAPSKWLFRASSLMTHHLSALLPSRQGALLVFLGDPSQDKGSVVEGISTPS